MGSASIYGPFECNYSDPENAELDITCMTVVEARCLWVGTSSGHVLILDLLKLEVLEIIHRYTSSIQGILQSKDHVLYVHCVEFILFFMYSYANLNY